MTRHNPLFNFILCTFHCSSAGVAQLVEQRIRNAWVGGSNPFSGTNLLNIWKNNRAGCGNRE